MWSSLDLVVITTFSSFCIWCFDILGPSWPCRNSPSESQSVPRDSKGLAYKCAFCVQSNQSRAQTLSHLRYQVFASGPLFLFPGHPKARYQTNRDSSRPPGPTKIIQGPANPKPAYSALPVPSHGNHNKGSHFPSFFLPPERPWCFCVCPPPPCSSMPPTLGNYE